ncbi:hypothetical protein CC78DRAFT_571304 [Lojkania enalia]|uniref:Uncharacterized protein n=1 Tax=Lojkania enalia TaxID=147567 RepID=A0A9P4MWL4_9PLEO|nr:hypothetical protein CC78DRAFT_571304 [Didymosphaeria enalia]
MSSVNASKQSRSILRHRASSAATHALNPPLENGRKQKSPNSSRWGVKLTQKRAQRPQGRRKPLRQKQMALKAAVAEGDALVVVAQQLSLGILALADVFTSLSELLMPAPPSPERRYDKQNYPRLNPNANVKGKELLEPDDEREHWEIGHLPDIHPYALDSCRIFYRDTLRSVSEDVEGVELEWKRVVL